MGNLDVCGPCSESVLRVGEVTRAVRMNGEHSRQRILAATLGGSDRMSTRVDRPFVADITATVEKPQ